MANSIRHPGWQDFQIWCRRFNISRVQIIVEGDRDASYFPCNPREGVDQVLVWKSSVQPLCEENEEAFNLIQAKPKPTVEDPEMREGMPRIIYVEGCPNDARR